MGKKKQYFVEFERTHNQWMVVNDLIRSTDPDANYGYYYHKTDAKKVADMLNQRVELLAALDRIIEGVADGGELEVPSGTPVSVPIDDIRAAVEASRARVVGDG